MGDILPPKRQTVVDRLRRRIELYRRHQNTCLPRYEQTSNGHYEQQRHETLLLKQRYLEAKAKKAKKSEHRSAKDSSVGSVATADSQRLLSKPSKRAAESSPLSSAADGLGDDLDHQVKIPRNSSTPDQGSARIPSSQEQNIPSFSVQIVQQFTSSDTSQTQHSQTIQTNVTVKALTGNIKTSNSPLASASSSISTSGGVPGSQREGTSISVGANVECKQEKDADPVQCSGHSTRDIHRLSTSGNNPQEGSAGVGVSDGSGGGNTNDSSGAERFSDTFPSLGFTEDSSDDVIHPDILKDLIDDVLRNSSDLMKDFNFEDSVGSVKDEKETDKDPDSPSSAMMDMGKAIANTPAHHLHFPSSFATGQPQSPPNLFDPSTAANNMASLVAVTTTATTTVPFQSQRMPTYAGNLGIGGGLGLDFKLTEPSPAALTLKQMAEQHQSMQQKQQQHQQLGLGLCPPHSRATYGHENFSDPLSSIRSSFMNGSGANLNSLPKGSNMFPSIGFGQQPSYSPVRPNGGMFKQESGVFAGIAAPPSMADVDMHKRQQALHLQQHLQRMPDQKPGNVPPTYGASSPDQKPHVGVNAGGAAYGATRPLSHYTDPSMNRQSPVSVSLANQFIRGATPGMTPPPSRPFGSPGPRPSSGPTLQMSQTQQLQITQNNQQLQVAQSQEIKQNPPQQPQAAMYGSFPTPSSHSTAGGSGSFQMSMTQSQSFSYTAQFPGASTPPGGVDIRHQMMQQQPQPTKQQPQQPMSQRDMTAVGNPRQGRMQQFISRPPPEYKAQTVGGQVSGGAVPPQNQQRVMMGNNNMIVMGGSGQGHPYSQPTEAMRGVNRNVPTTTPGGQGPAHLPSQIHNPAYMGRLDQQQALGAESISGQMSMQNTVPPYNQGESLGINTSIASTPETTKPAAVMNKPIYTSALTRTQRPPNVNVGPEGLNISQRPPGMTSEWRQMLMHQQNQSRVTAPQMAGRMAFPRGMQPANYAPGMVHEGMAVGTAPMMPRGMMSHQQQQSRMNMGRVQRMPLQSNQLMIQQQQQQQMSVQGSVRNQGGAQSVDMQMSSSVSMTTAPQMGQLYPPHDPAATATQRQDFSLDFLDNIESSASDLLNFPLLDDMNMLGK